MKIIITLAVIILFAWSFSFTACKSSGPSVFCDTACNNDRLYFSIDHPDKPYVSVNMKGCYPDTVTWSHNRMPEKRKVLMNVLTGKGVRINRNFFNFYIKDTSYVWMTFNDCISGQGFLVKIPFNEHSPILRKNSAFNSFDKKYSIAPNLAVYTDRGNIFVEDMTTEKKGMMTFGKQIEEIDYTDMHKSIDSINVTPDRVWIKIKIENEWQTIENKITLK